MDKELFDELAGRIDAVGLAMLRLAAALERQELIDGPRLSKTWRGALSPRIQDTAIRLAASQHLEKLAGVLDDARSFRLATPGQ